MSGGAGAQTVRGRAPASVSGTVVRDGVRAAASHMYPLSGAARCSRTLLRTPSRSGTREGRGAADAMAQAGQYRVGGGGMSEARIGGGA